MPRRPKELELDEMWTFVDRKGRKKWLWLAVERHSRRIVAWEAYRRVLPQAAHRAHAKGSGQTSIVESIN